MSRAVPDGWLKTGRREYENRTVEVEVEVKFQPTPDQDGRFEVWVVNEDAEESTAIENVKPSETAVRELAKDVMETFTEAYDAAVADGAGEDDAIAQAIAEASEQHRA